LEAQRLQSHINSQSHIDVQWKRHFTLDGRKKAIVVSKVENDGQRWIQVVGAKPFGFQSSNWAGSAKSKKRRGLERQVEMMLRAAKQNRIWGYTPRVVVRFTRGVSRPVAEALQQMGALVEGEIIEPPPPRAQR
jgi:hypothetical protein